MSHRYYTVQDIAGMLKMDPQIIRVKCRKGHLPAIKAPGTRDWRIPISDMETVLWELEEAGSGTVSSEKRGIIAEPMASGEFAPCNRCADRARQRQRASELGTTTCHDPSAIDDFILI
jgi:hypothetical protein